ncbi:DUF1062 domain-containing protein [Kitasatospora sp. NBC_00240]|uniref:DUF1062 domain-containing protein n=1 Tax=Kitasatospora sp. NBC_00240 TaxID=2903567 RepID=UPI002253D24B|nr:DUF1062 domain-containing protein [Kitasatospora sp. NBC_00240]MCX5215155.1 DUF1062 domain-containing protein [Kitasatospora sp. NBC_00240]
MHIDRKARWAVRQSALPTVVRPCPDCSGTRHRPSGKIRVNANGKLLDVWLLLSCATCDRTSKVPVHERVHVSSLAPARREAYEANDPSVVRELTMSASLAAKNGYHLDWTDTWELETRTPLYALDDPTPLKVLVGFELPGPVRVERLLVLGFGLSRSRIRRMVADGRIQLPLALNARTRQDFELTVHGPGSVDSAKHSKLLDTPTGVSTDLSRIGSHVRPRQLPRSAASGA